MNIPFNRLVAFLGPYIAIASGAISTWLLVHVHFLALFHVTQTQVGSAISQVLVFGVTTTVTWLGHQKWLQGHHVQMQAEAVRGLAVQVQSILTLLLNDGAKSQSTGARKTPGA